MPKIKPLSQKAICIEIVYRDSLREKKIKRIALPHNVSLWKIKMEVEHIVNEIIRKRNERKPAHV